MIKKIATFFIFFSFIHFAHAQQSNDKAVLQSQREQLRKEIGQTEKLLNDTKKNAKVSIGQLSLINKKMDLQGNVIENINGQIQNLNSDIYTSQLEVNKMKRALDTLKIEYAKSMVYAYKNRSNYDFINFIFSAHSFNDAIKRVAYLKSYRSYREMQAENILKTQTILEDKIAILSGTKKKKDVVLKEKGKELNQLSAQQQEKAEIVNKLKGKQKELTAVINAKRKQDAKLKNSITAMIRREIEIAKAEAAKKEKARIEAIRKNNESANTAATNNSSSKSNSAAPVTKAEAKPTGSSVLVTTEADRVLNASFEKNKGSLPWPVNGFVISHFGLNKLPGNIDYYNQGVTIGSKVGEPVKSVFDGEVTLVSYIGDNQAVYIKHGKYFTVYNNLTSVTVQKGSQVKTGQTIGRAGVNDEGDNGSIDFILMKESDNVNPQAWLKR